LKDSGGDTTKGRIRRGSRRFDGESEDSYSLSSIVDVISGSLKSCLGQNEAELFEVVPVLAIFPM
jgi:hypothetical protein